MKSLIKNILVLFLFPILIIRRNYFWRRTNQSKLSGKELALFGFRTGRHLLFRGKFSPRLLLNPVSIVRYFEYDFVDLNLQFLNGMKVLDISSPYLFGFYQSVKHSLEYFYINPDEKDLSNVISLSTKMNFKSRYLVQQMNALALDYPDNFFESVISISVIEHIENDGDTAAIKEIWRVLKPGGIFIFTVPVKKTYEIEYRERDEYNLNQGKKAERYFFQRIYDNQKIEERLLSSISNYEIISKKIFGSTDIKFYGEYKKRWMKYSYWETVKDPYYITTKFAYFNDIDELEDIGVTGLTIKKLS